MISDRLDQLRDYPFKRLDALVKDIPLPNGHDHALPMYLGEPRHGVPDVLQRVLDGRLDGFGQYPPVEGTPSLRRTIVAWLQRRYALPTSLLDADDCIIPVHGTREGLFMIALAAVPRSRSGSTPAALMPNPFYQPYKGGAVAAGAEPVCLPCTAETGFLPDLDSLDATLLSRTAIFYLCSPSNPQGAVADRDYLRHAVNLARTYGFLLVSDECYAEIYDRTPPPGILQICAEDGDLSNVVCFHSLSKRSSVPGLRHGFAAGDPVFMEAFLRLRRYAAAGCPALHFNAAEELWSEETHVERNRALYRNKIDIAERILGNRLGFFRPPGGFFLWLDAENGEMAARKLWSEAAVKVLPGKYLATDMPDGSNPADRYIRVALVCDEETTREGLSRIADTLT